MRHDSTRIVGSLMISLLIVFGRVAGLRAQQAQPTPTSLAPVPPVMWFSGVFRPADGTPPATTETVTIAVYRDREGGDPIWQETQTVAVRADGRYDLLLGSTTNDGMPLDLFTAGEPRWIGVRVLRGGEVEQPRVRLASVPYALKAADADTLGGKPLSAFVLAESTSAAGGAATGSRQTTRTGNAISPAVAGTGTTNQVTKWLDTSGTLGDSSITEVGGKVGIGTNLPQGALHLFGTATADVFAGMGPNLISGPAFTYGYGGSSLGRSVGFFNVRPDASAAAPNPSLRFLTSNTERMIITNVGNVGIGTSSTTNSRLTVDGGSGTAVTAISPTVGVNGGGGSVGVLGVTTSGFGVQGIGNNGVGVVGSGVGGVVGTATVGTGVSGVSNSGTGVFGSSTSGEAGHFQGDVTVTGTLTKGGGAFKIDHPLDPGNRYLSHSFVESPDMLNVYNGNITLDPKGEAWVALPEWFEALNRDFRYQLTPIGAPGPNLYIADELGDNHFRIAGGAPGGKVSWQVTGVRQDAWANAHRIAVEEDKPEGERGRYLHPDVFGQPDTKALSSTHVRR